MGHSILVFLSFYQINLRTVRSYKLNWLLGFAKVPVVLGLQVLLWKTLFDFSGQKINGFSYDQIVIYFVGLAMIALTCAHPTSEKIQADIQKGNLAVNLARPISYLSVKYAEFAANWSITATVAVPTMLLVAFLMGSQFSILSLTYVMISLILSSIIYFLFEVILGVMSIWMYRILGLKLLLVTLFDLLGGKIFPIDFLPSSLRWLSYLTPWRGVYHEPLSYLQGATDISGILVQLATVTVLFLLAQALWLSGSSKYDGGV